MPITFGMTGDAPPGWPKGRPAPRGFGFNAWWRPPGAFSGPLLANPTFRKLFLWRAKEILETVYTEDVFFPVIKAITIYLAIATMFINLATDVLYKWVDPRVQFK